MEKKIWKNIESFLVDTLSIVHTELDKDSIKGIKHYIDHAELEMAFEGLFIEIMKLEKVPEINLRKCKEIATLLKLDEESVFEYNFWEHFESYLRNNNTNYQR